MQESTLAFTVEGGCDEVCENETRGVEAVEGSCRRTAILCGKERFYPSPSLSGLTAPK